MKMIDFKLIGGILLIVGTSIGGGMLALPVSNAGIGFTDSNLFLALCWSIMTMSALLLLEINLWFPSGSNLISMANKTLGVPGKIITWITYIILLYTLLCAYIAGSSDVLQGLLQAINITIPPWESAIIFVLLFGTIVYMGMKSVDYVNRGLMFIKLSVYLLLILLIGSHIHIAYLKAGHMRYITGGVIMVLLTSFGYATIIPSLRSYFNDDVVKLRKIIIIGSLIPLVCYIAWDTVIMGVIPRLGSDGLLYLFHSDQPTTGLTNSLTSIIQSHSITEFFRLFTSICMLTAFLGVSISLFDFLMDGLNLTKKTSSKILTTVLTFLPPLTIVVFYPAVFIKALSFAGVSCIVLLLVLPTLMAWSGRYIKLLPSTNSYQIIGGKITLCVFSIASLFLFILAIHQIIA